MKKTEKALIFLEHIEQHLAEMQGKLIYEDGESEPKVMCKICEKTIDQIIEEKIQEIEQEKLASRYNSPE